MKKLLSLLLVFVMTTLSVNIAVAAKNEDNPPYSLPYLKNIDGAEYVRYQTFEDTKTENSYTEQQTIEMYDVLPRSLKNNNWDSIIEPFKVAFLNAGFYESIERQTNGDTRYFYGKIISIFAGIANVETFIILGEKESQAILNEGGLVYIQHALSRVEQVNTNVEDNMDESAEEIKSTLIVCSENGNISISLDNNNIEFDVAPQIINGRTMVPLRAIFEALGATVDWNEDTQTVTATRNETTISLTINNATMYVNGNAVTLDSPACIVDGRTLVPVRAISNAFEINVEWKEVTIPAPVVYDDLSANVNQINDMINKGMYLEAIQECEQTAAWHNCSPDDINLLNSLKASAQNKYDKYQEALKQANMNKEVTDSQKKQIFSIIKSYVGPRLKSEATAIWPDYTELLYFYGSDGKIHVSGDLEAMNSFGGYGKVSFFFRFNEDLSVDWWYAN